MTYAEFKKGISICMVIVFLANQCLPLHAVAPKKKASINAQVRRQATTAAQQDSYWIHKGAELAQTNCDTGTVGCVLQLLKTASKTKDPTQSTICVPTDKRDTKNKVCMSTALFAQGAVHAAVSSTENPWLYYNYTQKKVFGSDTIYTSKTDPFPIRQTAPKVFELITQWGVYYDSDMQALNNYFKGVADPSTCGEKGKNTCHEEMIALIGLAFLTVQQDRTAKENARKTITKVLNKKWNCEDGATVMKGAIVALSVLNTKGAWKDIDTFVTKKSLPFTLIDALGLMTVEGTANLGIGLNSQGYAEVTRYYNNSNEPFTYLDTFAAQNQGFKYPYNNPVFQYPNTNMFEEIGYFIGREAAAGNKSAQELAKKIMNSAISYVKYRISPPTPPKPRIVTTGGAAPSIAPLQAPQLEIYNGHWPVVVGIMAGATNAHRPWSVTSDRDGVMLLIQHVFAKGFWDLNAGTYMRIFNIASAYADGLTKKGTFPRMSQKSKGYINTQERYKKITKIKTLSKYADMAIFIVSALLSVASWSEAIKSIFDTGRWVKDQVSSVKEIVKYSRRTASRTSRATTQTITATATAAKTASKTVIENVKRAGVTTAPAVTTGVKRKEDDKTLQIKKVTSTKKSQRSTSKAKSSARNK